MSGHSSVALVSILALAGGGLWLCLGWLAERLEELHRVGRSKGAPHGWGFWLDSLGGGKFIFVFSGLHKRIADPATTRLVIAVRWLCLATVLALAAEVAFDR